MKKYRILVSTSDKYIKAVLPFAWLLKKYWPDHPDVVVGGFSEPNFDMPKGFSFISIGEMKDYPIDRWSDAIFKFFSMVEDEVIIFMLEDMWITKPVKQTIVNMAYDYMKQFKYVARLDLTGDRLHNGGAKFYGKLGNVDLIWSDPDGQYHLSTMPAFWRKEHLMSVMIPNETPWQLELDGTPRLGALKDHVIVLGTNAWPIKNTLAFRGGDTVDLLTDELEPEDFDEMLSLGLLDEWMSEE